MDWLILAVVVLVLVFGMWHRYQLVKMARATGYRVCNIESKLDKQAENLEALVKTFNKLFERVAALQIKPKDELLEDKDANP